MAFSISKKTLIFFKIYVIIIILKLVIMEKYIFNKRRV